MKIKIKNLNDPAGKYFVKSELEKRGIRNASVETGEVELDDISDEQKKTLRAALKKYDFDFADEVMVLTEPKKTNKNVSKSEYPYLFSLWGI